jgi:ubiquinone/menaquinone biosynthesis C-methylase UbiE
MVQDKNFVLRNISKDKPVKLELGCGNNKRHLDALGVDALDYPCVDLVGDIFAVLSMLPDDCVDTIYSYHFIEHIKDLNKLLTELERVIKPGGIIDLVVPHFSNPYFYSDPTHKNFFGLYTFCYFSSSSLFKRKVPTYRRENSLRLLDVQIKFKSDSVFPVRYAFKYLFGLIFNSTNYMREFYEENLSHIFPCYEIRYILRRQQL